MTTVYKYKLEATDRQIIKMPKYAEMLCVQIQDGEPHLWARVATENPVVDVEIHVYGTGHEINEPFLSYIGTFQLRQGALVFHVFYNVNCND